MIFQTYIPGNPLRHFVARLFYYEGLNPAHALDRFLPDGNTEFIIDLADKPQFIHDNETLAEIQTCRNAWVSGVRTRPITIPSGRDSRMLIVAFRRGSSHPFYSFPVSEITDSVVEADLIFGRGVHELREQLLAAPSIQHMFWLVEKFLLQQARNGLLSDSTSRCVDYAISTITRRSHRLTLQGLSHQIGYSHKHFISLFRKQVGVSPKQYLKIMRFQAAILAIERNPSWHWSEVALQNGFYDQAHFIHEFKDFSGFTPGEYMRRKSGLLNYVPVA